MEAADGDVAEIETICDSAPVTMVVRQTSCFDQRRVEREGARRGPASPRVPAPLAGPRPLPEGTGDQPPAP